MKKFLFGADFSAALFKYLFMIYESGVKGGRGRGRPIMGWMEGVKKALRNEGMEG